MYQLPAQTRSLTETGPRRDDSDRTMLLRLTDIMVCMSAGSRCGTAEAMAFNRSAA